MASKYSWQDFDWNNLKDDLDKIVALSRYYGSDPDFVLAGGGNTSVKIGDSLFIKASGVSLSDVLRDSFVELLRDKVRDILKHEFSSDPIEREEQVKNKLLESRKDKSSHLRPSVETMLHEAINYKFVVHTHPWLVNSLCCGKDGEVITKELFGEKVLWIDYADPGYTLAKKVNRELDRYKQKFGEHPNIILIQNHGIFINANDVYTIKNLTDTVMSLLSERISKSVSESTFGQRVFPEVSDRGSRLKELAPAIRAFISSLPDGPRYPIVTYSGSDIVMEFVTSSNGKELSRSNAFTPDQVVYSRQSALWVDMSSESEPVEEICKRVGKSIARFVNRQGYYPRIILVQGVGMFAIGESKRSADNAKVIYEDALKIMKGCSAFGGPHFMNDRQVKFIDEWEVESYRRKVASGAQSLGRVAGKVAIVTGGAQGFGEGIAKSFADQGAYVVVADINLKGAQATADYINEKYGYGRAVAIETDITNEASISNMLLETVKCYGGIDILVCNAGVLRAGSVKTMSLEDFEFVTRVNYIGYFLCVKHASPIMATQHKYNPKYTSDIVQINSKSGLQGSNRNSAYAGSKFGGIGLTQSFALELVEDGIKVNSICPGNYFDGPLWSDPEKGLFVQYLKAGKVPGAKTIQDVRRAYESKIPMGRGCTVEDIMHAIYYVIDQPYETGQAIVVTGGQLMR